MIEYILIHIEQLDTNMDTHVFIFPQHSSYFQDITLSERQNMQYALQPTQVIRTLYFSCLCDSKIYNTSSLNRLLGNHCI